MKIKFTDSFIRSLKPTGKPYSHGDTEHRGLMVRVSATGSKTFALAYHSKADQKTRFLTFGQYGDMALADAFAAHAKARAALAIGDDPQAEKIESREAKRTEVTFDELRAKFVAAVIVGQRTAHDRTLMLERTGRRFGWAERAVASITDDEATTWLERLKDRTIVENGRHVGGPIAAFAVMSLLREMFKWAKRRKFITANIFADLEVDGVRKPKRRKRFLTPPEIRQVWSALDTPEKYGMSHDAATAIRLILATVARPGMVCGMLSRELHDLDAPQPAAHLRLVGSDHHDGPVWILPHERMKRDDRKYESEEPFIVPLNALAVRLIGGARGGSNGRTLGSSTLTGTSKMAPNKLAKGVRAIVKALGMERWTPHDARRTAATMLGAIDVPGRAKFADHEIGWLLAHKEGKSSVSSTTEIYNRNDRFDEKRHMATLLGAELEKCIRDERIGLDRARYARAA